MWVPQPILTLGPVPGPSPWSPVLGPRSLGPQSPVHGPRSSVPGPWYQPICSQAIIYRPAFFHSNNSNWGHSTSMLHTEGEVAQ